MFAPPIGAWMMGSSMPSRRVSVVWKGTWNPPSARATADHRRAVKV
jgi:hypothetical protein